MEKYCIDCVYMQRRTVYTQEILRTLLENMPPPTKEEWACLRNKCNVKQVKFLVNPDTQNAVSCEEARTDDNLCGLRGTHYEKNGL